MGPLGDIELERVLALDIETVPMAQSYESLPEEFRGHWDGKSDWLIRRTGRAQTPEELFERAGIYAEFGRVVCISVGIFQKNGQGYKLRLRSYCCDDEKTLLQEFNELLNGYFNNPSYYLCAHNGKEFDFPYLSRRMLINGLPLPLLLNNSGKKPWELAHLLDTLDMWRFGDYKNFTSLALMAAAFGIPSPKDDIKGSDVARVYYEEKDLPRISRYCQKDVVTVAQLLLRLQGHELVKEEDITFVN